MSLSATLGGTSTTQPLGSNVPMLIPASVTASGSWSQGSSLYATLRFNLNGTGALVDCTYALAAAPGSSPVELPFSSCYGRLPGQTLASPTVELWGSVVTGSGTVSASIGRSVDDLEDCTIDSCGSNGLPQHSPAPLGAACAGDGIVCNGAETCNASGQCNQPGVAPTVDDGDPCTSDSSCNEPSGVTHTKISGCGLPTGGAPATYPGNQAIPSDFAGGAAFLYGPGGVQTNLTATMDTKRVAIVRGRVTDRDGTPLQDVSATIKNELYGSSLSSVDGYYDLAVNGGDAFVVELTKTGYLPVQRKVTTRWLDFSVVPDVVMTALDPTVNNVPLDANRATVGWTVARGSAITQQVGLDGARQARVFVPPGITITNWTPNPSSNLTFRATEFTVGARGPGAMPGPLPAQSAYTYAVELSIDQATQPTTTFSAPVIFYVEHFVGPPLSTLQQASVTVPAGSYDPTSSAWKPDTPGKMVRILNVSGGLANLSFDGTTPISDYTGAGITTAERQQLALEWPSANNLDLWRVPISHFTAYDLNWNAGLDVNAKTPPNEKPRADTPVHDACLRQFSIVECENQVLGESILVAGTPFSLNYRSERQLGYKPTITVAVAGPAPLGLPSSFRRAEVEITVAGKKSVTSFTTLQPNQRMTWSWDRLDAYGREVQGTTNAHVTVSYVYAATSSNYTSNFGSFGSAVSFGLTRGQREIRLSRDYDLKVGGIDSKAMGLGGWTLSPVHVREPLQGLVWRGDGAKTVQDPDQRFLTTYVQPPPVSGAQLHEIVMSPDGTGWVVNTQSGWIISKFFNGAITFNALASTGAVPFNDGDSISTFWLKPDILAPFHAGGVLVASGGRVVRVNSMNHAYLLAGVRTDYQGLGASTADGAVAIGSQLCKVGGVLESRDGTVLFTENCASETLGRIRRIRADGKLETIAGTGAGGTGIPSSCLSPNTESCRALDQPFAKIAALAEDSLGRVHFVAQRRILRIDPDNTVHLVAGDGNVGPWGDGVDARTAQLSSVKSIFFAGGALIATDNTGDVVRRIDAAGIISNIAGKFSVSTFSDNLPATAATFQPWSTAVGPDGFFYTTTEEQDAPRIRRWGFAPNAGPVGSTDAYVASPDGREVYRFDAQGKLLRTVTRERGVDHYVFSYDSTGRITEIRDKFAAVANELTSIAYGTNVTITSPYGRVTTLKLDPTTGYLTEIDTPNSASGEKTVLVHSAAGLLTQLIDGESNVHNFYYSASGLLERDENVVPGAGLRLTRTPSATGFTVVTTTPEGRPTTHVVDTSKSTADLLRIERRTHTDATNRTYTDDFRSDGSRLVTYPANTNQISKVDNGRGSDPRFGFGGGFVATHKVTSGSSSSPRVATRTITRSASTSGQDPFSTTSETDTVSFTSGGLDPLGNVTTVYDYPTSTRKTTTSLGRQIVETLDAKERTTQVAVPGNVPGLSPAAPLVPLVIGYHPDTGRVATLTQTGASATRQTTFTYDTNGFLTSMTTPMGAIGYSNHDAMGRPKTVTLPGTRNVGLDYDKNGNVKKVTTPLAGGRDHFFSANALELLGTYTPPSSSPGGPTLYSWDRDKLLSSVTKPQATITYSRDLAGRTTGVSYPTSIGTTESVTSTYDAAGHLAASTSSLGPSVTFSYSGDQLVTQTTSGAIAHTVNTSYDIYQRMTDRDIDGVAGAKLTHRYDADGVLRQITGTWGTYQINRTTGTPSTPVNGMLSDTTLGNLKDTYEYDEFGGLKHYLVKYLPQTSNITKYELVYARDPVSGRVTSKTEYIEGYGTCTSGYTYLNGALWTQTGNCPGAGSTWTYDLDGNWNMSGYTYDNQDRTLTDPTWSYTHDGDGNLSSQTSGGTWSFFTDPMGNLRRVTPPGGQYRYDYLVDGLNRRVVDQSSVYIFGGWSTTNLQGYIWDGDHIIGFHKDPWGPLGNGYIAHFGYGTKAHVPDMMVQWDGVWNPYRIITDQLGSVKMVIRATDGAVIEWHQYDSWGVPTNGGGIPFGYVPFGFAGGLWDGNVGLSRFGARSYNPWKGRWWSKDPSRFDGGINLYAYSKNDPVNYIDPNGMRPNMNNLGKCLLEAAFGGSFLDCMAEGPSPPPAPAQSPPRDQAGGFRTPALPEGHPYPDYRDCNQFSFVSFERSDCCERICRSELPLPQICTDPTQPPPRPTARERDCMRRCIAQPLAWDPDYGPVP